MTSGRLRREYFGQDETQVMRPAPRLVASTGRGGFTLRGHRLSSLYRICKHRALTLTRGYDAQAVGFILPKILKSPAQGFWKTGKGRA